LLADLMDEMRTFDEDVNAFKLLARLRYDGCPQARKFINSGGRDGQEKPTAA
jgi:hypothetical protein